MHRLLYTLALLGLLQGVAAQQDYGIYLQSGIILTAEEMSPDSLSPNILATQQFGDFYHLIVQFADIPTLTQQEALAALGITLQDYIPNYAFIAKIPTHIDWTQVNARAILPIQPKHKLSKQLADNVVLPSNDSESTIHVKVYPFPDIALNAFEESLKQSGFDGKLQGNGVLVQVPSCCLLDLAGHPAVLFLEPKDAAPKAEGWVGRTAQRLNVFSGGPALGFDGSGVAMAIGDDGKVSHEDFRGRITDFNTTDTGNHGEMTAGLAMGAGNLNPLGMGMAPGANLFLYPIENYAHLEDAVVHLQQHKIVLTSTSYGEGCGGIYTQAAQSMDKQVYQNEVLLHVFSAGNSGEEVCSNFSNYMAPDGGRFGTITGGRKAAKNLITVGNTAYDDRVITNSSRGPTADGRIKPDLCAHGQGNLSTDGNNGYRSGGGTSAAAPSLAGTAATLYQAYREWHAGANPSSALIKATLLNTADDLGNAGPDYTSGFGRVNAGKALELLQNNWYASATVSNGATKMHTISVPTGVQQLRVLLYWHDAEGLPNAAKALVNDLDLKLETPDGAPYLPWVLSRAAHSDSLNKPAYRGIDRVNNVEQITLDLPEAGDYNISVKGNLIPKGPQKYILVYYFVKTDLKLTYPNGGEGFVPQETETIRWDAVGNTGTFTLEYAINNSNSWQLIASEIAGNQRHYDWKIPDISATQVRIRVSRNGQQSVSALPFCILQLPDFTITHVASNAAVIQWRKVPGANLYDIYSLGSKYMDVIGTVADTSFQLNTRSGESNWYSVRARHSNGANGRRAFAQFYQHQTCDVRLTLQLTFDFYPSETFWDIKDASGKVWASGEPYSNEPINSTLKTEICLPYGCYTFNMHDSYNDGMCCAHGQGNYRLLDANGSVLATGGEFQNTKSHNICLQSGIPSNLSVKITTSKNISCAGGRDGAITVAASGGSGNYTYRWNNGLTGTSLSELPAGTYAVTVSDGVQQAFASAILAQPAPLNVQLSVQQGDCFANNNSAVTANVSGGTAPYTFSWSNGSKNARIANVQEGTYTVTVTDGNGCSTTARTTVQHLTPLNVNVQFSNPTCANSEDGKATATVSGGVAPFTYLWSNGSSNVSVSGLSKGTHSVTVTDSKGCQSITSINMLAPEPLTLAFFPSQAFGTNNGSIDLRVSGGKPGYQFRWSNGATTEDISSLGPGTYVVTVTDANGCTAIGAQSIEFQEMSNCSARGSNTRFEWIQRVQVNDFVHDSGNNSGYANFNAMAPPMVRSGSNALVVLNPGYFSAAFGEYWRIWIDFNQDGDFWDSGEEVLAADGVIGSLTGTIHIPPQAIPGATQMRISMRYGAAAAACGTFPYGEVEDYIIIITNGNNVIEEINNRSEDGIGAPVPIAIENIEIYPNPTKYNFFIKYNSTRAQSLQLFILNVNGQVQQQETITINKGMNEVKILLNNLPTGTYILKGEGVDHYFVQRLVVLQ